MWGRDSRSRCGRRPEVFGYGCHNGLKSGDSRPGAPGRAGHNYSLLCVRAARRGAAMNAHAVARSAPDAREADHAQSIDELDRAIVNLAGRINAATYDLLVLVRRFDECRGWLAWGFETCAEWLHWRCDIGLSAAREKVRVAHALKTLPAIGRAFAKGALSYSKVRALTPVASRENEDELLKFALQTTAA